MFTTVNAIRTLLGNRYEYCESPSLRLEKFLCLNNNDSTQRTQEINQVVACCNKYGKQPPLERQFSTAINLVARLEANLIINQAGGILENAGLCLEPLRGYPYIPGSAVKGVAHHTAWLEWCDNPDPDLAVRIARVFGYPTQESALDLAIKSAWPEIPDALAGAVSFLAAVPWTLEGEKTALGIDICTSHHTHYYQGKQEPFDDESPIPLVFPVVRAGAKFLFRIVPLALADDAVCRDARHWLINAICTGGIGAKTAAGYGWFSCDEKQSELWLQKMREEINKKRVARVEQQNDQRLREEKIQADAQATVIREREKQRLATMTPEQILDETVSKMSPEQFMTRIGQFCLNARPSVSPEEKAALLRALKGSRHEIWEQMRGMKRGKNTPNWPQIVNEIFALHKKLYDGEKMS